LSLSLRRIDCSSQDASGAIADLRRALSPRGDVVSAEGKARTIAAFGEPLSPVQVVERICADVASRGLPAVLDYTRKLDGVTLEPASVRVSEKELQDAFESAGQGYLKTLERIRENILNYQRAVLHRDVALPSERGIELGLRYRPIRRVGICVPGGAAAYPSTLLMTAVPAQAAGVEEIAVVVPPTRFGGYNTHLLAACRALGVSEVYRIGDRSIAVAVRDGTFLRQLDSYSAGQIASQSGQSIWKGELEISAKPNEMVTTAIPIGDALKTIQPGVYVITAKLKTSGDEYYGDLATQWFIVSDLGISALSGNDGIHAIVRSLNSAEAVAGVKVKLVATNDEVRGEGLQVVAFLSGAVDSIADAWAQGGFDPDRFVMPGCGRGQGRRLGCGRGRAARGG